MKHCVETITRLVAQDEGTPRAIFQLGYNLGRLSELTGLGREPFWDRWKEAVCRWDRAALTRLALELQEDFDCAGLPRPSPPTP